MAFLLLWLLSSSPAESLWNELQVVVSSHELNETGEFSNTRRNAVKVQFVGIDIQLLQFRELTDGRLFGDTNTDVRGYNVTPQRFQVEREQSGAGLWLPGLRAARWAGCGWGWVSPAGSTGRYRGRAQKSGCCSGWVSSDCSENKDTLVSGSGHYMTNPHL